MVAVHWFESDEAWFGKPFWIMARVTVTSRPTTLRTRARAGWPTRHRREQTRAWASGIEAMAAVHNLPLDALGPEARRFVVPDDPALAELERYDGSCGGPRTTARIRSRGEALSWLQQHQPAAPAPALVWGDARLSNVVYRDFEVVAVLDWEMATVGDPLLDLGWWIFADNTLTRGSGFARLPASSHAKTPPRAWAKLTGRSTDALDYYLVFAGLRFTVIMLRMGKLLAHMGFVPPAFPYDNLVSRGLERQLRRVRT